MQIKLTNYVFNVLYSEIINVFESYCRSQNLTIPKTDREKYGYDGYENSKNSIVFAMRENSVDKNINGKYLYNCYRNFNKRKEITFTNFYANIFFNYIGYKNIYDFLEKYAELNEKEKNHQLRLLENSFSQKTSSDLSIFSLIQNLYQDFSISESENLTVYAVYRWSNTRGEVKVRQVNIYNWQKAVYILFDKNRNKQMWYKGIIIDSGNFQYLLLGDKFRKFFNIILTSNHSEHKNILFGIYNGVSEDSGKPVCGEIIFRKIQKDERIEDFLFCGKIPVEIVEELRMKRIRVNNEVYFRIEDMPFHEHIQFFKTFVGKYEIYLLSESEQAVVIHTAEIRDDMSMEMLIRQERLWRGFVRLTNGTKILYAEVRYEASIFRMEMHTPLEDEKYLYGVYSGVMLDNQPSCYRVMWVKNPNLESLGVKPQVIKFSETEVIKSILAKYPTLSLFFSGKMLPNFCETSETISKLSLINDSLRN